ncbi:FixH family protein [uncultured Mesonia sp.]|uniref:FixH family protein n=1 Tax=uncultured Mesonia sp. TaxID=399731 RepID=UPI00374FDA12
MKINWGWGIVIAFVGFISFILYFVIKVSTNDAYEHDLVVEEYYKQELKLNGQIEAEQNVLPFKRDILVEVVSGDLRIKMPQEKVSELAKGTLLMYRPSNKKLDFTLPFQLKNGEMFVPKEKLVGGIWAVIIEWEENNKNYRFKKELHL